MSEDIRKMIDKINNVDNFNDPDIDFVFQNHPQLSTIGDKEQYSQYIKTIFPNSDVKAIVFHETSYDFDEFKPYFGKLGRGVYFSQRKDLGGKKGRVISALVNIKDPVTDYDNVLINNEFFTDKDVVLKDETTQFIYEIIVRDVNNIHILGSKKDIEGFKSFIKNKLDFK